MKDGPTIDLTLQGDGHDWKDLWKGVHLVQMSLLVPGSSHTAFLVTQNKVFLWRRSILSFIRDERCHLVLCLPLIEPNWTCCSTSGARTRRTAAGSRSSAGPWRTTSRSASGNQVRPAATVACVVKVKTVVIYDTRAVICYDSISSVKFTIVIRFIRQATVLTLDLTEL